MDSYRNAICTDTREHGEIIVSEIQNLFDYQTGAQFHFMF